MVIGDAPGPHGIELGLHRGVGRGREHAEFGARAERVCHSQSGQGSPFSCRKARLKSLVGERVPEAARMVTTVWAGPRSFARPMAPAALIALEPPRQRTSMSNRS